MGRKTFSMRWLDDGSVKLSKNAPLLLQSLAGAGLFNQKPLLHRKAKRLPHGFKPANETSVNQYGVEKDQIWESLDPRDKPARQVIVVLVGDEKALVENLANGKRSTITLKRFCGKTSKGFKRIAPEPPTAPPFPVISERPWPRSVPPYQH